MFFSMSLKALLLAAGRSTRMQPVVDKNAVRFFGKSLAEHQIESLIRTGFRSIGIVGGAHNLPLLRYVAKRFGRAVKISVIQQKALELGMAGAVLAAKGWIGKEPFILLSGNDIVEDSAFALFRKASTTGLLLAREVRKYFPGGYLKLNRRGMIEKIVEKPQPGREPSRLINIVLHYHPRPDIFLQALERESGAADGRYERALQKIFSHVPYRAVRYSGCWQSIKYPWHVLDMMHGFFGDLLGIKKGREVSIAKTAVVKGPVWLDDGAKILDHAVICGPAFIGKNSVIATNALVRQSHVGDNCVIGFSSEIARSYVGDHVWTHSNYIGDSIIGNNVSFGAGCVTGNLRLDEQPISLAIDGQSIDSGRTKLGLITGDDIRVGINTSFMPGVRIGSNSMVGAGIVVARDVPDGSFVKAKIDLELKKNLVKISKRP